MTSDNSDIPVLVAAEKLGKGEGASKSLTIFD
jgi:hypothetical protein